MASQHDKLSDSDYIWSMIKAIREVSFDNRNDEQMFRLQKIAWKLAALDQLQKRMKSIRTHQRPPEMRKSA